MLYRLTPIMGNQAEDPTGRRSFIGPHESAKARLGPPAPGIFVQLVAGHARVDHQRMIAATVRAGFVS